MALNVGPYVNALVTVAQASGLFTTANAHEPTNAPDGPGETCHVIGSMITGIQSSGLAALSARVEFRMRILTNAFQEPRDAVDTILMNSGGALMGELVGAYTLGGLAREIDLLGADGEPLRLELGYMAIGGGSGAGAARMYRVADLVVPITINDCWTYGE